MSIKLQLKAAGPNREEPACCEPTLMRDKDNGDVVVVIKVVKEVLIFRNGGDTPTYTGDMTWFEKTFELIRPLASNESLTIKGV